MKEFVLSKRYAKALLMVEKGEKDLVLVSEGLRSFVKLCAENRIFFHWLTCEEIDKKRRASAIIDISKVMGLPRSLRNFLLLLVENERIKSLTMIAQIFSDLSDDAMNILKGRLEAADVKGAEDAAKGIESFLHMKTKKDVRITAHARPGLIAGARLRIKNDLWDASVKKRLEEMKEKLCQ